MNMVRVEHVRAGHRLQYGLRLPRLTSRSECPSVQGYVAALFPLDLDSTSERNGRKVLRIPHTDPVDSVCILAELCTHTLMAMIRPPAGRAETRCAQRVGGAATLVA